MPPCEICVVFTHVNPCCRGIAELVSHGKAPSGVYSESSRYETVGLRTHYHGNLNAVGGQADSGAQGGPCACSLHHFHGPWNRASPRLPGRAQNGYSIMREIFRFRSLNVNCPYVRTVQGLGQQPEVLRLTPSDAVQAPDFLRGEAYTRRTKSPVVAEFGELRRWLDSGTEVAPRRLNPVGYRALFPRRLPLVWHPVYLSIVSISSMPQPCGLIGQSQIGRIPAGLPQKVTHRGRGLLPHNAPRFLEQGSMKLGESRGRTAAHWRGRRHSGNKSPLLPVGGSGLRSACQAECPYPRGGKRRRTR
jgi:hypothetical protein